MLSYHVLSLFKFSLHWRKQNNQPYHAFDCPHNQVSEPKLNVEL